MEIPSTVWEIEVDTHILTMRQPTDGLAVFVTLSWFEKI